MEIPMLVRQHIYIETTPKFSTKLRQLISLELPDNGMSWCAFREIDYPLMNEYQIECETKKQHRMKTTLIFKMIYHSYNHILTHYVSMYQASEEIYG